MPVDAPTLNKARWCRRRLLAWYERHGRQFPWRSSNADLYQRVVAEILLQRTQAATVSQFFDSFFQKLKSWDDIDAIAQLSQLGATCTDLSVFGDEEQLP